MVEAKFRLHIGSTATPQFEEGGRAFAVTDSHNEELWNATAHGPYL